MTESEIRIGPKIKKIRKNRGLTLKNLSESSGLSVAFISQIENEQVDPSWSSLKKITAALNIELKDLFDTPPIPFNIVRSGQGYCSMVQGIHRQFLAAIENANMEMFLATLPAHGCSGILSPHMGEEFIWILDGCLEMTVDNVTQTLEQGDSFYFRSQKEHMWKNNTDKPCIVLWVDSPPIHI